MADDAHGGHDFYTLLRNNVPLSFWCFDLLSLRGNDLRQLPLGTRRARLRKLLPSGPLHFSEAFVDPHALLKRAAQFLLEGIVSKRVDLPYRSGKRPEWVKVKAQLVARGQQRPLGEDARLSDGLRTVLAWKHFNLFAAQAHAGKGAVR